MSDKQKKPQNNEAAQEGHGGNDQTGRPRLTDPETLLKQTFAFFRENIFAYIGILLVATVGVILAGALLSLPLMPNPSSSAIFFVGALTALTSIFIFLWGQTALIQSITAEARNVDILRSYRRALPFILPILWVSLVNLLIVVGGYTLFIIPGIILSILFIFAPFIVIAEDTRGYQALVESREYVRDYWWAVLGRLLVLVVIALGVQVILSIIYGIFALAGGVPEIIKSVISMGISFVLTPFFIVYQYLLYKDLRRVKSGETPSTSSRGQNAAFLALGVLGAIAIVGISTATIAFSSSIEDFFEKPRTDQPQFTPTPPQETVPPPPINTNLN